MMRLDRRLTAVAVLAFTVAWSNAARAQHSAEDEARQLFDDAKSLADAGRWVEACPRLDESLRLSPNMVTEFRLADCLERTGRKASAWSHYRAAALAAGKAGDVKKQTYAEDRAAQLEPTIDKLLIVPPDMPDIEVERDGKQIPRAAWSTPSPLDPGEHTVHVWAPKMSSFDLLVHAYGRGELVRVVVPPLELAVPFRLERDTTRTLSVTSQSSPGQGFESAPRQRGPSFTAWGFAVGAVGLLAAGGGVALYASSRSGTSADTCGGSCVGGVAAMSAGAVAVILGTVLVLMDRGER